MQVTPGFPEKYTRYLLVAALLLVAGLAVKGAIAPAPLAASASVAPSASPAFSASPASIQGPATLVFQNGEVAVGEAAPGGEMAWRPAVSGMTVLPGMRIRTSDGYADLLLPGRSLIRIAPHTELVLTRAEIVAAGQTPGEAQPQAQGGRAVTRLFLSIGRIWVHVIRQFNYLVDFEVQTPSAVAGVRGTIFSVMVAADGSTVVSVQNGKVAVSAKGESKTVHPRQEARSRAGERLTHLPKLSREEAQVWKEQEDWLQDQEELDKQAEKERRLQKKGGAGDHNPVKNSDDDGSEHKEGEGSESKSSDDERGRGYKE